MESNIKTIYDFFYKYRYVLIFSYIIGIYVYSIDIFNFRFSLDSEYYALAGTEMYSHSQRYGSILLYYIFPFLKYHAMSQLFGLFVLILSALLVISKYNISNNIKACFVILTITFPNLYFLQYFYFQSAYNYVAVLMTVISFLLADLFISKRNILFILLSIILLTIALSSYQALASIYLTIMIFNIILEFLLVNTSKKILIKKILFFTSILFISVIMYYVLCKILSETGLNNYHSGFIKEYGSILSVIGSNINYIFSSLTGRNSNFGHTAILLAFILLIFNIIQYSFSNNSLYNKLFYYFLIILLTLAAFSLNIVFNNYELPLRTLLSFSFYFAAVFTMSYILLKHKYLKMLTTLFIIVSIFMHADYLGRYQTATMLRYENDKITAADILSKIYSKAPDIFKKGYYIYITGTVEKYNEHAMMDGKDFVGVSFFALDDGSTTDYRIKHFLHLMGLPLHVSINDTNKDEYISKYAKEMESYPSSDCVKVIDNAIILKLH